MVQLVVHQAECPIARSNKILSSARKRNEKDMETSVQEDTHSCWCSSACFVLVHIHNHVDTLIYPEISTLRILIDSTFERTYHT